MRLSKKQRDDLEKLSREFEGKADFGSIMRNMNAELYCFYNSEIKLVVRKAFEIGYITGMNSIKRVK